MRFSFQTLKTKMRYSRKLGDNLYWFFFASDTFVSFKVLFD